MTTFSLKTYQSAALEAMALFLRQAETMGLEAAWAHAMQRDGGNPGVPYRSDELGEVPTVCLRIPTGGGKTLLASHAIARIAQAWSHRDFPLALWLVPSDTIRSQTLAALQTPGHAYQAALKNSYGDRFVVCELDALHTVPPQDFGRKAVVVVATIQSFRVSNKAGRRVYATSEAWETHFKSLNLTPQQAAGRGLACVEEADLADENQSFLSRADLGRVKTSLANWLAWQQPIVIVDEAHNAKTPLSLAMLRGIRPSCVLDLTATPVPKLTNVLYSVSARQLEAEDMIKLPIMLAEHETGWQDAVRDALLRRTQLEAEAAHEPRYVRPIALFQAQDKGGEATAQVLKQHLIDTHHIDEREIAVATGTQRELDGVNLFDPACPVRYVITVDALKEGWDCSFAYVLCSLQNLRSNQAVEQLMGRVLRMPYAQRRRSPALNKAYAHVIARSFSEAAHSLVDSLTQGMGFDALSAASVLLPDERDLFGSAGGLPAAAHAEKTLTLELELAAQDAGAVRAALQAQPDVQVLAGSAEGEPVRLRVTGPVTEATREAIFSIAASADKPGLEQQFDQHDARLHALRSPAERDVPFAAIPQLCVRVQGELELIERETLGELIEFDLLRADARPELPGFNLVQQSDLFEIYLEGERVRLKQADAAQLSLDAVATDATEQDLVIALEAQVRRGGLTQLETQAYVQKLVSQLLHQRGLTLTGLIRSRFQLGQMISKRIDSVVAGARQQGFQNLLFGRTDAQLTCDAAWTFEFRKGRYPVRQAYSGRWQFEKHYYPQIAKLKSEGEEFECAVALDRESAVKHWVRNLEQLPEFAFWLPTATDYFYPDFVAELHDGRLLVVEYKGDAYVTNDDSREKRLVGERWAQTTGQRFVMVEKTLNGMDMAAQIRTALKS
ncbi:MAG: restriction endonuclease subunit R [Burkholderiaceae bacterium]|nr:MAG: restriction endonuclease subunit R [Burkholderiaceae bacterium]TBR77636.1 MAG: restriction endonuclease subunit R [Burkholderiaceae bacterium]